MEDEHLISQVQRLCLRTRLALTSGDCELDVDTPSTCPFHQIQHLGLDERIAWLDELSEEAILNVNIYCQMCCENRRAVEPASKP